ncbi:MAG: RdgB/HAM1 family non-canonical purine NTP pyrophosphatase [Bacilli bacterium]|jgi:XTP/dITP diphosphohydrolase|nr:RdgB/HAM1 family non-canonical purine NTP pyrophosphatase [Acholeplasmataceae bacterium]
MKLLLATRNKGKKDEIIRLLEGTDFEVITLNDLNDVDEVVENGNTFYENALIKAKYYHKKYRYITLADDSGLVVDALGGAPGINSARYSGIRDDKANMDKLLAEMEGIENRKAAFVCSVAICNDRFCLKSEGRLEGEIALKPQGEFGFGYDPIFYLPDLGKTLAELDPSLKNMISHRAQAIKEAISKLKEVEL